MEKKFDVIPIQDIPHKNFYGIIVSKEAAEDGELGYFKDWGSSGTFVCILSKGEGDFFQGTKQHIPKVIATINKRIDDIPFIEMPKPVDWDNTLLSEVEKGITKYEDLTDYGKGVVDTLKEVKTVVGGYSEGDMLKAYEQNEELWPGDFKSFLKSVQSKLPKSVVLEVHKSSYTEGGGSELEEIITFSIIITNPTDNIIIPKQINYESN